MSGTTSTPPSQAQTIAEWGKVAVSLAVVVLYGAALLIAYLKANDTLLNSLLSIAGAQLVTVVGFWLGSSFGSDKKTNLMVAAPTAPPAPAP